MKKEWFVLRFVSGSFFNCNADMMFNNKAWMCAAAATLAFIIYVIYVHAYHFIDRFCTDVITHSYFARPR